MYDEKKLLGVIGLCRGAGKAIVGVPMICEHLRKQSERYGEVKNVIVIEASDTSDNTHKRIVDRTTYYHVPAIRLSLDGEALAVAVGKRGGTVGAVGVTDESLAAAIAALYGILL